MLKIQLVHITGTDLEHSHVYGKICNILSVVLA